MVGYGGICYERDGKFHAIVYLGGPNDDDYIDLLLRHGLIREVDEDAVETVV